MRATRFTTDDVRVAWQSSSQAKVSEFYNQLFGNSGLTEKKIVGLDVSMDDSLGMKILQGF